jgi:hypothetical protein
MFTGISSYPAFYDIFRRVSALFPSLARLGVGRLAYRSNFDALPPADRDVQFAFWCTARHARSARDEWAEAPALMRQAGALQTLGSRPLVVVTALNGAMDGWVPLQDEFARLSTSSVHRMLPDVSHASLVGSADGARSAAAAIHEAVVAVSESREMRAEAAR